jgi:hypothetical protein
LRAQALCGPPRRRVFCGAVCGDGIDESVGAHGESLRKASAIACNARCKATRTAPSVMPGRSAPRRALAPSACAATTISR